MQNTDGDPLELTTLTYELGIPPAAAVERLTPLATLRGDAHISDEDVRRYRRASLRDADVDQGRQSQDEGVGQHDTRDAAGQRIRSWSWRSTRRGGGGASRRRSRSDSGRGDARRYDGHRYCRGARAAGPHLVRLGCRPGALQNPPLRRRPSFRPSKPSWPANTGRRGLIRRCRPWATGRRDRPRRARRVGSGWRPCWRATSSSAWADVRRSNRTSRRCRCPARASAPGSSRHR